MKFVFIISAYMEIRYRFFFVYLGMHLFGVTKFQSMNCRPAPALANHVTVPECCSMSMDCRNLHRSHDNDAYANRYVRNWFYMHDNAVWNRKKLQNSSIQYLSKIHSFIHNLLTIISAFCRQYDGAILSAIQLPTYFDGCDPML